MTKRRQRSHYFRYLYCTECKRWVWIGSEHPNHMEPSSASLPEAEVFLKVVIK